MPALTRAQVVYPGESPLFYGSTDDALAAQNQAILDQRRKLEAAQAAPLILNPPQVASVQENVQPGIGPTSPSGQAPQPIVNAPNVQFSGGSVSAPPPAPATKLPFVIPKPTFQQANEDSNGLPLPINNSETKLGKFVSILLAGAKGGLAGEASSEQALAQSGGRRNGGFGTGFEAAQDDATIKPVQEAMQKNALDNQQLESQQKRALLPWMLRSQQLNQQETQAHIALQQAQTEANSSLANKRDLTDADKINAKSDIAKKYNIQEGTPEWNDFVLGVKDNSNDSLLKQWRSENPSAPVSQFVDMQEQLKHKYDRGLKGDPTKATPGEFGHIEEKKNADLQKLRSQFRFNKDSGQFEKKDNSGNVVGTFTPDEWRNELQQVQNDYEANLRASGGTVQHYEYPASGQDQTSTPPATPAAATTTTAKPAATNFKLTQNYNGHNYGRNSASEAWKRID